MAQNSIQCFKLLRDIAYAFGVRLKALDRREESDAGLEGEGRQSQQPGSQAC